MNTQRQILSELGYRPSVSHNGMPLVQNNLGEKRQKRCSVRRDIEAIKERRALER
ncbi:MAG: hypothetical protein ACPGUD_13085 [Parashewanella sp.]